MSSDLESITRDLERQRRELDDRAPLWQEGDDVEHPDPPPPEASGSQQHGST